MFAIGELLCDIHHTYLEAELLVSRPITDRRALAFAAIVHVTDRRRLACTAHATLLLARYLTRLQIHFLIFCLTFSAGCSLNTSSAPDSADQGAKKADTKKKLDSVLVSAAASTQELLEAIGDDLAKEKNIKLTLNLGATSTLANQIIAGAPADLFLSASSQWADEVMKEGLVLERLDLLTNRLVVVIPSIDDSINSRGDQEVDMEEFFKTSSRRVLLAGENVPAGIYAEQALKSLGLFDTMLSEKRIIRCTDVRSVVAIVERGEVDAGIVYLTDSSSSPKVRVVHRFDSKLQDPITYVLMRIKGKSENPSAKIAFDYLRSSEANLIYERLGFTRITAINDKP